MILLLLCSISAWSATNNLSQGLDLFNNEFINSPKVKSLSQQLEARIIRSTTASRDRGLTIIGSIGQQQSPNLSGSQLQDAGGIYSTNQGSLNSKLTLGLRNVGIFNSTEISFNNAWVTRNYQKSSNLINTVDSYRDYSMGISYDLVRGGYNDLNYLNNKVTEKTELFNLLNTSNSVVRTYLDYRFQLLDIFSSYCKLMTSNEDLQIMRKVVSEITLSYQLKSISYKNYLNVIDTFNFIQRNNITYDLSFQLNLQRMLAWSDVTKEEWEAKITNNFKCPKQNSQFREVIENHQNLKAHYSHTLLSHQARANLESTHYALNATRMNYRPSVKPYLQFGQEDSSGFNNRRLELGVQFAWDTPSSKNTGEILSANLNNGAAQNTVKNNEQIFNATVNSYQISIGKYKQLLDLSLSSFDNSNALINLLEVQKSIGQVDSLSLSNAFTQRNQILNNLYDSLINLEKTRQELIYLENWKSVIALFGIEFK
jgi:hypothetical protein